ncbi:hypothetical protein Tco_0085148, partial [Tanacetum coccineum]
MANPIDFFKWRAKVVWWRAKWRGHVGVARPPCYHTSPSKSHDTVPDPQFDDAEGINNKSTKVMVSQHANNRRSHSTPWVLADEEKAKAIAFDEINKSPEENKRRLTVATNLKRNAAKNNRSIFTVGSTDHLSAGVNGGARLMLSLLDIARTFSASAGA